MATLSLQQLRCRHIGPVDLTVRSGECVCISGASGSGKSLLLRAIADLDPHEGEVLLDHTTQSATPPTRWRQQVGLLPAQSQWWFDRVAPHFKQLNNDYLQRLGFDDDVLRWEIARLSSGEKQRLALLRLLSHQPRALLLDEASANLDHENSQRVEALVQHYRETRQAPVIWISHDAQQAQRIAQRRFNLEKGQLGDREITP